MTWEDLRRGWRAPSPADPLELLKQQVRELEDRVPALHESLAMLKAGVTLAEKEVTRLAEVEQDLQAKVDDAEARGRADIAANYAVTLDDVRRQREVEASQLVQAREAFETGQRLKCAFMEEKERRIQEAKQVLNATRAAGWHHGLASALTELRALAPARAREAALADVRAALATSRAELPLACGQGCLAATGALARLDDRLSGLEQAVRLLEARLSGS